MKLASANTILKTYPPQGPLRQYRLEQAETFHCFRCGQSKTSKLICTYGADWHETLCNACYGRLLHLFRIKSSSAPHEDRADAIAQELLSLVDEDTARRSLHIHEARLDAARRLEPLSVRFLGTSQVVADRLQDAAHLDWSAAVLGLCKAFELEIVHQVMEPLRGIVAEKDLASDLSDSELCRVTRYLGAQSGTPPELGTMARFFRTAISSKTRAKTSPVIQGFRKLVAGKHDGAWLCAPDGLPAITDRVALRFRNPAVHTAELSTADYSACQAVIIGDDGALWKLLAATA